MNPNLQPQKEEYPSLAKSSLRLMTHSWFPACMCFKSTLCIATSSYRFLTRLWMAWHRDLSAAGGSGDTPLPQPLSLPHHLRHDTLHRVWIPENAQYAVTNSAKISHSCSVYPSRQPTPEFSFAAGTPSPVDHSEAFRSTFSTLSLPHWMEKRWTSGTWTRLGVVITPSFCLLRTLPTLM